MSVDVTVAIPIRDGAATLPGVLAALACQSVEHELLVCDSGSRDGSIELAREHGARVIEIAPERFSHGGTRNLLVAEAHGEHVALLTQDAEPAGEEWLGRLLDGFDLGADVGIVYGPYRPRVSAKPAVRAELEGWFSSLSPDGSARVERLAPHERSLQVEQLIGRRGFFTDANACLARAAWERVPFREVPYAEDRVLAIDMLHAGYGKAYVPAAAVFHSHDYSSTDELKRCFDEWRGLREVYGWREPASPRHVARKLRGELSASHRAVAASGPVRTRGGPALASLIRHHVVRLTGALLGSRAGSLPSWARRRLSLEGRAGFEPLSLDVPPILKPTQDGEK
jgi:glycosyltransferase involved in cell wall biosynthesis